MSANSKPSLTAGEQAECVSRRGFLASSAWASGALALGSLSADAADAAAQSQKSDMPDGKVATTLTINGSKHTLALDPRTTLLDLLREDLDLTGTKVGCDHGQCGACTVLLDGIRVNACFVLAVAANGKSVVTIEGLAGPKGNLHPMQVAFIEEDGLQCGYCTPGQIISAIGCVKEGHAGSDAEIREYMSGNLCRCGAYQGIVKAVKRARDETREREPGTLWENT